MTAHLETYFQSLQSGCKPLQVSHGFMHTETHGAVALDARGLKPKGAQTRLYVYPDVETETLWLITIGDKVSQRDDNSTCREWIVGLREARQQRGATDDSTTPSNAHDGEKNNEKSDPP